MRAAPWASDAQGLGAATAALARGEVVGFPTDTVYGLAASARDRGACRRLSAIKGRSGSQPLILMAATLEAMAGFVVWSPAALDFAQRFWPGPLTLVLVAGPLGGSLGGGATLGVRIPDHPIARRLLEQGGPLATSSANRHQLAPAADAEAALRDLPGLGGALADPAPARLGAAPSSILDLTQEQPVLLREGALSAAQLGISATEKLPGSRRD
ncbi:MAG: L-threonylcarbamoyladenylate synthase [Candidatus Dormibacteria bacterium]